MESVFSSIHVWIYYFVELGSLMLEVTGIIVMIVAGVRAVIKLLSRQRGTGVTLAEGIATTLEFLLAAEVLHTVLAESISDLIMLAALVVIRAAMTLEIHLELRSEKRTLKEEEEAEKVV